MNPSKLTITDRRRIVGPRPKSPELSESDLRRFYSRYSVEEGCWRWKGLRNQNGHGLISVRYYMYFAHRIAYELRNGPIDEGLVIDHKCHTRECVNPDHLRAVTQLENMQNLSGAHVDSVSGVRGVSWDKARNKWRVDICVNYKRIGVGRYDSFDDAVEAAEQARLRHFGEVA